VGFRTYRENDIRINTGRVRGKGGVLQNTEMKEDWPHIIARDQLIPRIVDRNLDAVAVDRVHFYFYQRNKVGRRCSCWSVETSPDGLCQVCWGTGIVGGYTKWGTVEHILDVSHPIVNTVNVLPAFDQQTTPVMYVLANTATKGYLETRIDLTSNTGVLDLLQVIPHNIQSGNSIVGLVKKNTELNFVELNGDNVEARLDATHLDIRIELTRENPESPIPFFSHMLMRYRIRDDVRIQADIPRQAESMTLAEFGVYDSFSSIQIWTTLEPMKVTTEDFFHKIDDGKRFKVTESQPNKPLGWSTSHDLQARLVQKFEAYARIP
jgi:hypothetical protein